MTQTTRKPAYPKYDELCNAIEHVGYIGKEFPAPFCQKLLEEIETQAQRAQSLPRIKGVFLEVLAYLNTLPSKSKAEKEARQKLIERAQEALNNGVENGH